MALKKDHRRGRRLIRGDEQSALLTAAGVAGLPIRGSAHCSIAFVEQLRSGSSFPLFTDRQYRHTVCYPTLFQTDVCQCVRTLCYFGTVFGAGAAIRLAGETLRSLTHHRFSSLCRPWETVSGLLRQSSSFDTWPWRGSSFVACGTSYRAWGIETGGTIRDSAGPRSLLVRPMSAEHAGWRMIR